MEKREEVQQQRCSVAKRTILTTHPNGLQTTVSVEVANFESVFVHSDGAGSVRRSIREETGSFLARRGVLGGLSAHGTPVLGRRSDAVNEGRLSQQSTPVTRRRELVDSPRASPSPSRRAEAYDEAEESFEVDISIISGWLKFRDGKKWKPRWGVVTKLSPAADCLYIQLYGDPKDRYKKGQTKASLSLQHFLGFESGFTLDKESHTIAIITQDVTVVLAFETRERLISWQVKVGAQLGSFKDFIVMIGKSNKSLPAGPARLHLQGRRFALTSGIPPRLLGIWQLTHLRRYGVVDGRFCFEGGSHCGKGEGLHLLMTEEPQEITDAFDVATQGNFSSQRTSTLKKCTDTGNKTRPSTRMSELNTVDFSLPDTTSALYEENFVGKDCKMPYRPSDERRRCDERDLRMMDVGVEAKAPWGGADHVILERCNNCRSKLGATSKSSTVDITPGHHFNPAWTMESVPESHSSNSASSSEYLTPREIKKTLDVLKCDNAPNRPPKPAHMEQKKAPMPLPLPECLCKDDNIAVNNSKVGPYENYDVPKTTHSEVNNSEYYDTPKRLKQALSEDLFQVAKSSAPGNLVLKKNCGCILQFASKKKPVIVESDENIHPVDCPCQKVTNWANNLISIPYCTRSTSDNIKTGILTSEKSQDMAIYATVDVSKKTNRKSHVTGNDSTRENDTQLAINEHIENKDCQNYENLEFSRSLEYYENAKDLLKKAGVTQTELDALRTNLDIVTATLPEPKLCMKCGHSQTLLGKPDDAKDSQSDDYLLMQPTSEGKQNICKTTLCTPNPGYTPMSPHTRSLKHPLHKLDRAEKQEPQSIPTLNGSENSQDPPRNNNKNVLQKRTSLENLKESSSTPCKSGGNRDSSSSNDSGVSNCSLKQGNGVINEFEMPLTSGQSRHQYIMQKKMKGILKDTGSLSFPRKSKSFDPLRVNNMPIQIHQASALVRAKASSAEAEFSALPLKPFKGVMDTHSTSSGTSDMSDYIETLSMTSSQSSSDGPGGIRTSGQPRTTMRPRSGKEYHNVDPTIASTKTTNSVNYTNLP